MKIESGPGTPVPLTSTPDGDATAHALVRERVHASDLPDRSDRRFVTAGLMLVMVLACLFFIFIVLGTIAWWSGISLFKYLAYIKEEILARDLTVLAGDVQTEQEAEAFTDTVPPAKLGGHQVTATLKRLS